MEVIQRFATGVRSNGREILSRSRRYSLRTLLIVVSIVVLSIGWRTVVVRRHHQSMKILERQGAFFFDMWEDPIGPNAFWARDVSYFNNVPANGFCEEVGLGDWFKNSPLCTTGYFNCMFGRSDGHDPKFGSNEVEQLRSLLNLKGLDIQSHKIDSKAIGKLNSLRDLKHLTLGSDNLTENDIESLCDLQNLEHLTIIKNPAISESAIANLRRSLPNCEVDVK
jgi:hypothetical protein